MNILSAILIVMLSAGVSFAQLHGMDMWGGDERCPLCGNEWDGGSPYYKAVPERIDAPRNQKWLALLQEVLALEEFSKKQYESDQKKFKQEMPYGMVIPQEDSHIRWIRDLFSAYGVSPEVEAFPISGPKNLDEAYENAMKLEEELTVKYEQLISNAEDKAVAEVLGGILLQTRLHYVMFSHASQMGGMMDRGMWQFRRKAY